MNNFEKNTESAEAKNQRFIEGGLTEAEIKECWANPGKPIFEHEIIKGENGAEKKTRFQLRVLSEELKEPLFDSVKNAWDELSYNELKETIELFFEQKKQGHPALLNVEYYVPTDIEGKPFGVSGIYTIDIDGTGFATREKLDPEKHYMTARLGWFSIGREYQGTGVGGFLQEWTEKMAKSRGAKMMGIETSTYEEEAVARAMYEKRGYVNDLNPKDYFGPGRDLFMYFCNTYGEEEVKPFEPGEQIDQENKGEIFELAKKVYSKERAEEFEAALDLLLQQKKGEKEILSHKSFLLRDENKRIESAGILYSGVYDNVIFVPWAVVDEGNKEAESRMISAIKGASASDKRYTVVLTRDKEAKNLSQEGFELAKEGIPRVYTKEDTDDFLFYTKRL